MSANINFNQATQQHAFYDKKEIPWWNLGYKPQGEKKAEEVLIAAQLNWQVEKLTKYIKYPDNTNFTDKDGKKLRGIISPNDKALVRMDTGQQLGNCSDRYEVLNNIDAFNFIDNIVGEKLAIYETAGALDNGETIFVTAKLPSFIKPTNNKDDIIEKYILFTSSHDGSSSVKCMFTPIRVVCNNTLNMALRNNTGRIIFKHTKNLQEKVKRSLDIMGLYREYEVKLTYDLARMVEKNLSKKEIDTVLANTFLTAEQLGVFNNSGILLDRNFSSKTTNNLIYVQDYIEDGPGQQFNKGTAYWLYNGITSFFNNGKEYTNDTDRFESLLNGNEYKYAQKAYNIINDLCLV